MTTHTRIRALVILASCLLAPYSGWAQTPAASPAKPATPATPTTPATQATPATPAAPARALATIPKESLRAIRERGTLKACVSPYMPWVIEGAKEGEVSGFSIDLARQLAQDLGVTVEFVGTGYADLIPAVVEGDCDLIPAGIAATPDRALFVHFTTPVAMHDVQLVGAKAALGSATRIADVTQAGLTVGVVGGSAELLDARRRLPSATIQEFESLGAVVDALTSGKVKAAVAASPFPQVLAKMGGNGFAVVAEPLSVRGEAFAVRRGDLEFQAYLNDWVQARTSDGWLKDLEELWFTKMPWADGLQSASR